MAELPDKPLFHFFRVWPRDLLTQPPLASSLQTLETCFFEIGLRRFPHALVSCATACESAIKAKLGVGPEQECTLERLIEETRRLSASLRAFSPKKLDNFRRTRNRIIHYGFSPRDDEECAVLLLETGLPFLKRCYSELFGFFLDWHDIRPGNVRFDRLTPEELRIAGLRPEIAEQLRFANEVFLKAKHLGGLDRSYCFTAFIHYIRVKLKHVFMAHGECEILENDEVNWQKHRAEEERKEEVARFFKWVTWNFCCPICDGEDSLVAELDETGLDAGRVTPKRCVCVHCDFVVPALAPFLSEILLAAQSEAQKPAIFREYGIEA